MRWQTCSSDSNFWKSLNQLWKPIMECLRWKINNGEATAFWLDNWVDVEEPLHQFVKVHIDDDQIKAPVKDFRLNLGWDWKLLDQILPENIIAKIKSILAPVNEAGPDKLTWFTSDGCFSVTSAYSSLMQQTWSPSNPVWAKIWRTSIPQRIQVFLWQVYH